MRPSDIFPLAAIGVCVLVSAPVGAQTAQTTPTEGTPPSEAARTEAETGLFVRLVQPCIDAPGIDTCAEVRAVITECAEEFDRTSCDVLFTDPDEIFDDPEQSRTTQALLRQTRDAMPEFPPMDTEGAGADDLDPEALEAGRAAAERTYLRGDANQMTHSQPELLEGELDDEAREAVEDNGSDITP